MKTRILVLITWFPLVFGLLSAHAEQVLEKSDPEGHVEQIDLREAAGATNEGIINLPTPPEDQLLGADIEVHRNGEPESRVGDSSPSEPSRIPTHRASSPGDRSGIRTHAIGGDKQSEIRIHGPGWSDTSGIKIHR